MLSAREAQTHFGPATLGSVGLHVLAAVLIPALAWSISTAPPVETVSFAQIQPIELLRRIPPQPQPRPVAPRHSLTPSVSLSRAPAPRAVRETSRHPQTQTAVKSTAPTVAERAVVASGAARAAAPTASATPQPQNVASAGRRSVGGYLPFGADEPNPILDPAILKALLALGVHTTLVVTVGDDGHTKAVAFDPVPSPAIQGRIQSLLADANWDPAVCGGGIACQADATIKL